MKVNIDKYYIVLINELTNVERTNILSDKVKYTVVSKDESNDFIYKDLLSDEKYKISIGRIDRIGTLFINPNFTMIPVNAILESKKQFIFKSLLIKKIREYIIDLNLSLLEEDKKLIKKRGGVIDEKNI